MPFQEEFWEVPGTSFSTMTYWILEDTKEYVMDECIADEGICRKILT